MYVCMYVCMYVYVCIPPMYVANKEDEAIMLETDSTVVNSVCRIVIYTEKQ